MAGLNTQQIIDRARQFGLDLSNEQADGILSWAWDQGQWGADEGKVMSYLQGSAQASGIGQQQQQPQQQSADDYARSIMNELAAQMDEMAKRVKEYDAKNPFMFDEIQAQKSAEERYNPYYEAELNDFVSGIQRQKQTIEGEKQLLFDMNKVRMGEDKRSVEDAIRASEEGFSGAGLFFSGARERGTGKELIQGQDTATKRELGFNADISNRNRQLLGLGQEQATGERRLGAEKTTAVQTEIEKLRAEERARHETEKAQYLGPQYTSSITGGLNELIKNSFGNY